MDRAELPSGIGNFYGNSTRSLWTTYPVLPALSNLWSLSTTPRICLRWINEPTQNRHKIHLKQSRKHRNRKQSVKFWPVHSLHNAPRSKLSHIPPRDTGSYNQSPTQVQLSSKWVPRRWEQAFAGQRYHAPHRFCWITRQGVQMLW